MTKLLAAVAVCLLATPALGQVEVTARTEKPQFLAGEPVFVLVEVENIGSDPVAYGGASVRPPLQLSVRSGQRKVVNPLTPCGGGGEGAGGAVGIVDHPPMLRPGQSTTFRHLLRGYRLTPGAYELRVSGSVDVAWRETDPFANQNAPQSTPKRSIMDPVEGATIDRTLSLTIVPASEENLRIAFAPYVAASAEFYTPAGRDAISAMLEMAPAFLEPEIQKFVRQRGHESGFAQAAAEALAEIDTPSSRADLIAWFDRSGDLRIRSVIVRAVARTRHPDNLPFLASLLPGRSAEIDDHIRRSAALGIGLIGGEMAVEALRAAPRSPNPLVAGSILLALGTTNSRSAIPILIERAEGQKGYVSNDVCTALMMLTHRTWCGGVGLAETQKKWRTWWAANANDVRIYGPDDCPDRPSLPHIWH
jgi:hypothetical protein